MKKLNIHIVIIKNISSAPKTTMDNNLKRNLTIIKTNEKSMIDVNKFYKP